VHNSKNVKKRSDTLRNQRQKASFIARSFCSKAAAPQPMLLTFKPGDCRAPSARHICSLAMILHSSSVQERHHREKKEYVAPPGLGILRASSGYKDFAPDGAEDVPQRWP
jgi:hypothetical protein